MLDFKPGRARPKRKPARRSRRPNAAPARRAVPVPAPKSLRRVARPAPARPLRAARLTVRNLAGLAFAVLVGWLALGMLVEGVRLWQAPLRSVDVWGNRVLSGEEVAAYAGLHEGLAVNEIDPLRVAARLAQVPRIKAADVRRFVPGRVAIVLEERVPFARLRTSPEVTVLIDREGVVVGQVLPGGEATADAALPTVRWTTAAPVAGQRVGGAALARGLRLLDDLQALGIASGAGLEADIDDPFALVVSLPGRQRRVIFPADDLRGALTKYLRVAARVDALDGRFRTVDLRTASGPRSPRIILQR